MQEFVNSCGIHKYKKKKQEALLLLRQQQRYVDIILK